MVDEQVRLVAKNVLQRAEEYKNSVDVIIDSYNKKLQETDEELQEILVQLDRQQYLNKEAVSLMGKVNEEVKQLETDNGNLEELIGGLKNELRATRGQIEEVESARCKLEHDLEAEKRSNAELEKKFQHAEAKMAELKQLAKKVSMLETEKEKFSKECYIQRGKMTEFEGQIRNINKHFSEKCGKYDDLFTKCKDLESRNAELEKTILKSEKLIEPFRPQLEAFFIEALKIGEETSDTEEEAIETDLQYDEIVKYDKRSQEIKELIQVKEKNTTPESSEKENS